MRSTLLAAPLIAMMLSGCQGNLDEASTPETTAATDACRAYSMPTVVRYKSRQDARTRHSVHLLNGPQEPMNQGACGQGLPLASIVTLSYQVAGG